MALAFKLAFPHFFIFYLIPNQSSHQDSMRSKGRRLEVRDWGRLIRFEAF